MPGNSPLLLLRSPLGDDTLPYQVGILHATKLTAREKLSQPFDIDLTVVCTETPLDPKRLLHQPVAVTLRRIDGVDRFFHGLVSRVSAVGRQKRDRSQYELKVVPRLWFMSQTVDCRIFQQKTTVEILGTLFSEHDVTPVDFRLFGDQNIREYTTQYNETTLDFVHRLLQESGYFYFFEHTSSDHTLVITNRNEAFKDITVSKHKLSYSGNNVDIFDDWVESLATTFGQVRLQDWNPKTPARVDGQQQGLPTAGASKRDVFRWPAMTLESQVAADRSTFRMQAAEALAGLRRGHAYNPNLCPGFCFVLEEDPYSDQEDVKHVVHSTVHRAVDETWIAGGGGANWDTDFTCFLDSMPWRDDFTVPRPVMSGIYSALVLTEKGEEIHADPLARVKVQPLFNHRNDMVTSQAIWIRILHAWSGNGWGWQHLPRVGTEVGVSFMNGDPDNPVIVGCFYNEDTKPAFEIPKEQTKQGFRSRSTIGGGRVEYNELSFDDERGKELVYLQAEKDHKVKVKHDQESTIDNNRTVKTKEDDSLTSVLGNITVTAEAGSVTVSAKQMIKLVCGEASITLTPETVSIQAPAVVSVQATKGAVMVEAGGEMTISSGLAMEINAALMIEMDAGLLMTVDSEVLVDVTAGLVAIESLEAPGVLCLPAPL